MSVYLYCIAARLDLEGAQAIQTEELVVEEDVDYVLSVGEERIALQPKTLQDKPVKELISVRKFCFLSFAMHIYNTQHIHRLN